MKHSHRTPNALHLHIGRKEGRKGGREGKATYREGRVVSDDCFHADQHGLSIPSQSMDGI